MIEKKQKEFAEKILEWGKVNYRKFPWRKTKDPYLVFIAEQLLRKTTVTQVEKVYSDFVKKYPSVKNLAQAKEDDLKRILTPLGIENQRASLFLQSTKKIMEEFGGHIPKTENDLKKLNGVGQYTANSILSMVYNKNVPMVDTNAVRVIKRVFNFKSKKARMKDDQNLWKFVHGLIPDGKSKLFNLAIIDFANAICRNKSPFCGSCPISNICIAYENGSIK